LESLADGNPQITSIDKQVKPLLELQKDLRKQRETLLAQIKAKEAPTSSGIPGLNGTDAVRQVSSGNGVSGMRSSIQGRNATDYMGGFEWAKEVKSKLRNVWGIRNFRLCQEGVINASMDGREYVGSTVPRRPI
jgi:ATP-dependent DNA helicase Q1